MIRDLDAFQRLVDSFRRLPSVGQKSAERMAYAVMDMDDDKIEEFSTSLLQLKKSIHTCPQCGIYTDQDVCEICRDPERDHHKMIVVSYEKDAAAFERLGTYRGQYHVLHGALSAVNGVGIQDLNIDRLLERIQNEHVEEVILATNPTIEGETTALFLAKILSSYPVQVSRLAYGLPMGGHLDYADTLTLERALEGRTKLKE